MGLWKQKQGMRPFVPKHSIVEKLLWEMQHGPTAQKAFRFILSFPCLSLVFGVLFDSPIWETSVFSILFGSLLLHLPNPGPLLGFVT